MLMISRAIPISTVRINNVLIIFLFVCCPGLPKISHLNNEWASYLCHVAGSGLLHHHHQYRGAKGSQRTIVMYVVTLCTIWEFLKVLRTGSKNKSRICFTYGVVNVTLLLRMNPSAQEHMFLISQTHILHLFGWQCNKITQSDPSFQFRRLLINISLAHGDVRQKHLSPSSISHHPEAAAESMGIGNRRPCCLIT